MNKNRHRIVFNAARGQRMVVAETARHHGGLASGEASSRPNVECYTAPSPRRFHALALAALLLFARSSYAQVVADPSAPGSQRPTILQTANGLPQINIQTPSAAGVSRNTYSQFDVQSNGVILNNSRTNTNTQLAGQISANPWLATGEARLILNEVRSSNPTLTNAADASIAASNSIDIGADTFTNRGLVNANEAAVGAPASQVHIHATTVNSLGTGGREVNEDATSVYNKRSGMLSKKSSEEVKSESSDIAIGSSFSGGNVVMEADRHILIQGSSVNAQDLLLLDAGRDVTIASEENTSSGSYFNETKKSGLSADVMDGVSYGKSRENSSGSYNSTAQSGGSVTGGDVIVQAGRDAAIRSSVVVADTDLTVIAGRDVRVEAASDTLTSSNEAYAKSTTIGIEAGASGRFTGFGQTRSNQDGTSNSETAVQSLLSANAGSLTLFSHSLPPVVHAAPPSLPHLNHLRRHRTLTTPSSSLPSPTARHPTGCS